MGMRPSGTFEFETPGLNRHLLKRFKLTQSISVGLRVEVCPGASVTVVSVGGGGRVGLTSLPDLKSEHLQGISFFP